MSIICLLDEEPNVKFVTSVKVMDLVSLYKRDGLDIRPIFGEISRLDFYHCPSCDLRFFYPLISGPTFFYEQLQKKAGILRKRGRNFSGQKNGLTILPLFLRLEREKGILLERLMFPITKVWNLVVKP